MVENLKDGMECIGLKWNEKKCAVMHVKPENLVSYGQSPNIDGLKPIKFLRENSHYKFLGVRESVRQEEGLVLELAAKEFLRRVFIIWSSPLYDHAKAVELNQYAFPVFSELIWTQTLPLAELQQTDRDTRKIISGSGGSHPRESIAALYLTRNNAGRGLKSVEEEHKDMKIKAAVKLYENTDPSMTTIMEFEEKSMKIQIMNNVIVIVIVFAIITSIILIFVVVLVLTGTTKVYMTRSLEFIRLLEKAFKMMKNGAYLILIALFVAKLFKILVYGN